MRLFELILQNVSPLRIAKDVVEEVSRRNGGDISVTIKHFLHSIMDAVGYNYYVTLDEISHKKFEWPEENAMYFKFHYERSVFEKYEIFLETTCRIMNQENQLESLIETIDIFLVLCDTMVEPWADNFREPFSLIAFSLLKSMHKIRKDTPDLHLVLDNTCHKLFENSQKGLGYPESHTIILKGLCLLMEREYDYFSYFDEGVFKFYINCLEYEFNGRRGQIFIHMKNAIDNLRIPTSSRTSLINFLTDSKMIKAYCVFAEHSSNNLVSSLLKFLNSLLSHLPVLECFTREQLHRIFSNSLKKNKKIRSLAAKFYAVFMRKSFTDKLILRDILDFYLVNADGIDDLDNFIETLWDHFPYMASLEPYLRILGKTDWSIKALSVTAQFAYRVYYKLYKECENNDDYALRLSKFLPKLPFVLNALADKWPIRGILLQIYSVTDPELAIITLKDFPIAADRFVNYALHYLTKDDEKYTVVQNTAYNMLKLMQFLNMQDEMEHFASSVHGKYKELMSNPSELTEIQVKTLQHALVLLSIITDTTSALNEYSMFELSSDLRIKLIDSNIIEDLAAKHNCFLDSFAITTFSGCLNILSIMCSEIYPDETNTESNVVFNQVHSFLKYLIQRLGNDNKSKDGIVFAEAAIRALCDIYIVFNFKLERHVYHILVNSVNTHVFEATISDDELRQLELQRNIMHCFNLLHKNVEIPTAITWKIVIHYGLASNFEKELAELMDILFEYNSEKFKKPSLFTYVVPVAIYNLFQRRIGFQQFRKALNYHKRYVEAKMADDTQRVMKAHIALTMIDMIERAMKGGEIHQQSNRMELLSNMNILLTDAYQSESNLILNQSKRLEQQSLSRDELDTLTKFQERLSQ